MFLRNAPGNKHDTVQHKGTNDTEKWVWDVGEEEDHPRAPRPSNPFPERLKNGLCMTINWDRKQEAYLQGRENLSIKMFALEAPDAPSVSQINTEPGLVISLPSFLPLFLFLLNTALLLPFIQNLLLCAYTKR